MNPLVFVAHTCPRARTYAHHLTEEYTHTTSKPFTQNGPVKRYLRLLYWPHWLNKDHLVSILICACYQWMRKSYWYCGNIDDKACYIAGCILFSTKSVDSRYISTNHLSLTILLIILIQSGLNDYSTVPSNGNPKCFLFVWLSSLSALFEDLILIWWSAKKS